MVEISKYDKAFEAAKADLAKVEESIKGGKADLQAYFQLQNDLKKLENDPSIPAEVKAHFKALIESKGDIDLQKLFQVNADLKSIDFDKTLKEAKAVSKDYIMRYEEMLKHPDRYPGPKFFEAWRNVEKYCRQLLNDPASSRFPPEMRAHMQYILEADQHDVGDGDVAKAARDLLAFTE